MPEGDKYSKEKEYKYVGLGDKSKDMDEGSEKDSLIKQHLDTNQREVR